MTGGPWAGPASAYPTLRRPASICFSEPNDVFGLIVGTLAGFALPDCAAAEPIIPSWAAAIVVATVPKKRRRSYLVSSDILILSILVFIFVFLLFVILFLQTLDFTAADRRGHQERVIHIGVLCQSDPTNCHRHREGRSAAPGFYARPHSSISRTTRWRAALPIVFFPFALCLFCSH